MNQTKNKPIEEKNPFEPEYEPEQGEDRPEFAYYQVDADTLVTHARLNNLEYRFKQIDKTLEDAQLVLYGVAIGLSFALILSIVGKIGRIL